MLRGATVASLPAGSSLPETSISVLNGAKAKVVKALIAGKRQPLEVVSQLQAAVARRPKASTAAGAGSVGSCVQMPPCTLGLLQPLGKGVLFVDRHPCLPHGRAGSRATVLGVRVRRCKPCTSWGLQAPAAASAPQRAPHSAAHRSALAKALLLRPT